MGTGGGGFVGLVVVRCEAERVTFAAVDEEPGGLESVLRRAGRREAVAASVFEVAIAARNRSRGYVQENKEGWEGMCQLCERGDQRSRSAVHSVGYERDTAVLPSLSMGIVATSCTSCIVPRTSCPWTQQQQVSSPSRPSAIFQVRRESALELSDLTDTKSRWRPWRRCT